MSIDDRLHRVCSDVFGIPANAIGDGDSPQTVEAWDSVGHLNLVLALEGEFGVQFEAEEIPDLVSVGAIRRRLRSLTSSSDQQA